MHLNSVTLGSWVVQKSHISNVFPKNKLWSRGCCAYRWTILFLIDIHFWWRINIWPYTVITSFSEKVSFSSFQLWSKGFHHITWMGNFGKHLLFFFWVCIYIWSVYSQGSSASLQRDTITYLHRTPVLWLQLQP